MATTRRAEVTWNGDVLKGNGVVTAASSQLFKAAPVSWPARTETPDGKTSPEELLAAAHATCFAMAFSAGLCRAGTPPTRLQVSATVTFDKLEAGFRVTKSEFDVVGTVAGIDAAGFQKAAEAAKDGCPISQALKNNVALSVTAKLA